MPTSLHGSGGTNLESTPLTEVQIEGIPVCAMVDTGTPITIISLECLLQVLAERKPADQLPDDWKEEVKHA